MNPVTVSIDRHLLLLRHVGELVSIERFWSDPGFLLWGAAMLADGPDSGVRFARSGRKTAPLAAIE